MPIYTSYNHERQRYEFTAVGVIRAEEFLEAQERAVADPNFKEACSILSDLRRATYQFSEAEMVLLSTNRPTWMEGKQITYLVSNGRVVGLLRRYLETMGISGAAVVLAEGADPAVQILCIAWLYCTGVQQAALQLMV